jgi:hypothetical protein
MQLFKEDNIKKALRLTNFIDFLDETKLFYGQKNLLECIRLLPWQERQNELGNFIITGLNNLKNDCGQPIDMVLNEKTKGIYFCLAGDASDLSIHASLYSNETDWAANAKYYNPINTTVFEKLSTKLGEIFLKSDVTQEILYSFAAFTLLKTLKTINNLQFLANATIVLGYSDGDELILGQYLNQQFIENIELIEDGKYENSSTAPIISHESLSLRGELWDYMLINCMPFIKKHGLTERFYKFGEEEARQIKEVFKNQLWLNQCPLCDAIKKTPQARLCLKCGEFTMPAV